MGRPSPGRAGGRGLISARSRGRARATRGWPGRARGTVMFLGVEGMGAAEGGGVVLGRVGDGAGEPADDCLAGDSPVFVVVLQVGVEVACEVVLGVGG